MKKRNLRLFFALVMAAIMLMSMGAPAMAAFVGYNVNGNLPTEKYVNYNEEFTLSVDFYSGGLNTSYQWYTPEGPIYTNTATGPVYATEPSLLVKAYSNNTIWCVVNCAGSEYVSNRCNVILNSGYQSYSSPSPVPGTTTGLGTPIIVTQPVDSSVVNGQNVTLSFTAQGTGGTLCCQWYCSSAADGSNAVAISGANSNTYTVSATAANKYYFAAIWATNGYSNSSPVYTNVVKVTYNDGQLKITKNPTGETVDVGGSALFIARADNATSITWRLVSQDKNTTVTASNAGEVSSCFPGMSVTGANSETLTLVNIPASLDGWAAECKFTGVNGVIYSRGAIIRVNGAQATPTPQPYVTSTVTPSPTPATSYTPGQTPGTPTIDTQPTGAVLAEGQTTTLTVAATASEGATLEYQWYRNDKNSNANGTAIAGAQDASYTPDTISGSKYYYVGIWSTDGTNTSKVIYSSPVAVTYTAPIATPAPQVTPSPQPSTRPDSNRGLGSMALLPVIIMVVAAVSIGVGAFFLLRNINSDGRSKSKRRDDRYYDDFDDFDD